MPLNITDDEERWIAVQGRDPRTDATFVYAVRTTGVYCRPTCPSRLPNRANATFFATIEDAERRGFRACKKCRPRATMTTHHEAVVQACRMIEQAAEPPSLDELASAVGLSAFHFHRLFKRIIGVTPKAYAVARRAERFRQELTGEPNVTQAMYAAGFVASSRCYESAGEELGMTPREFMNGGAGQSIRYAVTECSYGPLIVAATERGICTIAFGDDPMELRTMLARRFPQAALHDGGSDFQAWVAQVIAFVETPALGLDLPLDIQGTAFQRRVWEALRAIPMGTTMTYAEVARKIGSPKASRAVGAACAANKLAIVVPCHRVLASDGGLGGFRWGLERKAKLLERERGS